MRLAENRSVMRKNDSPRFLFVLLGACALLFQATPSLATSTAPPEPVCPVGFAPSATPAKGSASRAPANLPAIAVTPGGATGMRFGSSSPGQPDFRLIPDPASAGDLLLVPDAPLEPGVRYDLTVDYGCDGLEGLSSSLRFDAVKEVALPTQVGELAATAARYGEAFVLLTPTPEMAAFLSSARFEIRVEGAPWAVVPYGAASVERGQVELRVADLGGPELSSTLCEPGDEGIKRFDLELHAHVAGASTDPEPATLSGVPIDCTPPAADADADAAEPARGASDGGCSVALAPARRGGALSLSMLALASATLLRRRGGRR